MSDPDSIAEVERNCIHWLDQQDEQITSYLNSWQVGQSRHPEEIWGIVMTLDRFLGMLNEAVPAASTLSRQGAPNFIKQLNNEIFLFQMKRAHHAKRYEIAVAAIVNAGYQRVTTTRMNRDYINMLSGSCFDCGRPGVAVGGGYCLEHARMRGLIR